MRTVYCDTHNRVEDVVGDHVSAYEIRATSESGGEKGRKPEELGAIDPLALRELARVAAYGANKYEAFNYLKGYPWSWNFNALQRHLLAMWSGEDRDLESDRLHAAHAAWHCLALVSFYLREVGDDDRPKLDPASSAS